MNMNGKTAAVMLSRLSVIRLCHIYCVCYSILFRAVFPDTVYMCTGRNGNNNYAVHHVVVANKAYNQLQMLTDTFTDLEPVPY